jgi:two-component system, chemotaxis family, protein-glutamate methylesterase/glutaminase
MAVKVLIVDNSLYMRSLISSMLEDDPDIEVLGTARSGPEALEKISYLKPDVITLDLEMPGWDGLTTLEKIMSQCPAAVIILSAHSKEGANITLECFNRGAVSAVLKPSGELSLDIDQIKSQLIREIQCASKIRIHQVRDLAARKQARISTELTVDHKMIVMGASTGGPKTLETILPFLPANFLIPVVVVQHVSSFYMSQSLAKRLDQRCALNVRLAHHHEMIKRGTVYIAPCGFRLTMIRDDNKAMFHLEKDQNGTLTSTSPSVDDAMKSAADCYSEEVLGLILTGMGTDGVAGMKAIKRAGGHTIAQDESAIVFGMPQAAIEAGVADEVLAAEKMVDAVVEFACTKNAIPVKTEIQNLDPRLCGGDTTRD